MATIYISTITGDDLNDGLTTSTPVKNIAAAFALVSSGDVIMAEREENSWVALPAKEIK